MIIVEGTDLVGKTTLCHKLVEELNRRGHPHIYSHFSKLPDCFDTYWGYVPFINRYVVQDRFHLSRMAYSNVCKDQRSISYLEQKLIESHLLRIGAYIVVVYSQEEVIKQRYEKRKDKELYSLSRVLEVNEIYTRCRDSFNISTFYKTIYVKENENILEESSSIIEDYIKIQEELDHVNRRKPN